MVELNSVVKGLRETIEEKDNVIWSKEQELLSHLGKVQELESTITELKWQIQTHIENSLSTDAEVKNWREWELWITADMQNQQQFFQTELEAMK